MYKCKQCGKIFHSEHDNEVSSFDGLLFHEKCGTRLELIVTENTRQENHNSATRMGSIINDNSRTDSSITSDSNKNNITNSNNTTTVENVVVHHHTADEQLIETKQGVKIPIKECRLCRNCNEYVHYSGYDTSSGCCYDCYDKSQIEKAKKFFEIQDYEEAIKTLKNTDRNGIVPLEALYWIGRCYFELENYAEAKRCFAESQDNIPWSMYYMIVILLDEKNINKANEYYRKILKTDDEELKTIAEEAIKEYEEQIKNKAKENAERERLARQKAEQEKLAREKAERERLLKQKAEQELARQKAEQERLVREKAEQERLKKLRIARQQSEVEQLKREEEWINQATIKELRSKIDRLRSIYLSKDEKDYLLRLENTLNERIKVKHHFVADTLCMLMYNVIAEAIVFLFIDNILFPESFVAHTISWIIAFIIVFFITIRLLFKYSEIYSQYERTFIWLINVFIPFLVLMYDYCLSESYAHSNSDYVILGVSVSLLVKYASVIMFGTFVSACYVEDKIKKNDSISF